MPKLRRTPEQIRKDQRQAVRDNTIEVIRIGMAETGLRTVKELAEVTGLDYQRLARLMRGKTDFDAWTMAATADALRIDEQKRASMLGTNRQAKRR